MSRQRPLEGVRVVVTRPEQQSGDLVVRLTAAGAEAIELPVIAIDDPPSWDELDAAVRKLAAGGFEWVVFSSVNGVEKVFSRLAATSLAASAFDRVKVAAVGAATADLLARRGVQPDLVPPEFTTEALARSMGRGSGSVLLPRVQDAPAEMVELLEEQGWTTEQVAAYRTTLASPPERELARVRAGAFDVVTFTSSSTVRNFRRLAGDPRDLRLAPGQEDARKVACIGPVTARTARRLEFRVDAVAHEHTDEGLVAALVELFARGRAG